MRTLHGTLMTLLLATVAPLAAACSSDNSNNNNNNNNPDLAMPAGNQDLASAMPPDLLPSCTAAPNITCTDTPTTHEELINACVGSDVTKVDITPFYPPAYVDGNCKLPAPPQ